MNKRYIRTFILLFALLMGAANNVWALGQADIIFDPASPEGGTVAFKSIDGQTVTITVTPADYYYVKVEDIVVQKLQDLGQAQSRRRVPDIADRLTVTSVSGLTETDATGDYTFVVPADCAGALVTVTFTPMNVSACTFNIVDTEGHIAIKYTMNRPKGSSLSSYTDIPESIRSPYLVGETVTFYSTFSAEGSRSNLSNPITEIPADDGNIYVSYTTDHLDDKPLNLSSGSLCKMQVNGEYIYSNVGNLSHTASDGGENNSYLWKLAGSDPYRVQIQNMRHTRLYFNWSTSPSASLTLDDPSNFIILGGSAARPAEVPEGFNDQIELMAATGTDIRSNPYYNVGRDSDIGLLASNTYGHGNAAVQVLLKAIQRTTTFHT